MSKKHSIKPIKICEVKDCGRKARAKNQCDYHCRLRCRGEEMRPLRERRGGGTMPRIVCDEVYCPNHDLFGPCHVYRGNKLKSGYGIVSVKSIRPGMTSMVVHRWCWEREVGPIPEGLVIDHMCRNKSCCNVDHLRAVTYRINAIENSESVAAKNEAKTHCYKGHPFTEESLIFVKGKKRRVCWECEELYKPRRYELKRMRRLKKKQELEQKKIDISLGGR